MQVIMEEVEEVLQNIHIDGDGDSREDNYEEEDRSHPQNNDFESLNPEQN